MKSVTVRLSLLRLVLSCFFLCLIGITCEKSTSPSPQPPEPTGTTSSFDYLGQTPPGMTPEPFAHHIFRKAKFKEKKALYPHSCL